jgi:predicted O-methyltransferase YrrM
MDNIIMYIENVNDNSNTFQALNKRSEAIEDIVSAWKGHRDFAESIVKILNPKIIVDLGVDWGYSSFCFANPDIGKVYAIDLFCPNEYNNINTLEHVNNFKDAYNFSNLEFIQADFCDLAKSWTHEIDILHIDGWHSYEEVKRDFNTWSKFVSENGIILMHDTEERSFGVKQFFNEIQLPKFNFLHSSGLGVVCKNETTFNSIKHLFKN